MPDDARRTAHRLYDEINATLWVLLCAVTLYVVVFVLPHVRENWARAERAHAQEIAAENSHYCEKWGMTQGMPKFEIVRAGSAEDPRRRRASATGAWFLTSPQTCAPFVP